MKKLLFVGFILISFGISSFAQKINTVAGNGIAGGSGNGGMATAAELHGPFYAYFDNSGNLLFPDRLNNDVRMVNTAGVITLVAGTGSAGYTGDGSAATAATLNSPEGISADNTGNVYICDHGNNAVRVVNTSGIITTIAGNGSAGFTGDGGQANVAELYNPIGVTLDKAGNIYITDTGNERIRKINTSGVISTIAGTGISGFSGDGAAATNAQLNWPAGIVIDSTGNIIFTDFVNNCVRKINTSGIISTIAGIGTMAGYTGNGGPATAGKMNLPNGISMDKSGNIFVAEENNNCVREINTSGIISTVAGNTIAGFSGDGGQATAAELNIPVGTAVNPAGDVFVTDFNNNRVREIVLNTQGVNTVTGVSNNIYLYPNPATNVIHIETSNAINSEKVVLYSIGGKKIMESKTEGKQNIEISTSNLSNGVYFVAVVMADESSVIKKVEVVK